MFDKIKDIVSDITGGGDLGELELGGVEQYLDGVTWPVSKDELIDAATRNGAPAQVVAPLQNLQDGTFNGPEDVVSALTGGSDAARGGLDDASGDLRRTL